MQSLYTLESRLSLTHFSPQLVEYGGDVDELVEVEEDKLTGKVAPHLKHLVLFPATPLRYLHGNHCQLHQSVFNQLAWFQLLSGGGGEVAIKP